MTFCQKVHWISRRVLLAVCLFYFPLVGRAHDSPEHVIEALSARMDRKGKSAELLLRRATEYRISGKMEPAVADVEEALRIEPMNSAVMAELSRLYLAQGKNAFALEQIDRALRLVPEEQGTAFLHMVRGEICVALGRDVEALDEFNRAIFQQPREVEWYFLRAQIQSRLRKFDECAAGLDTGYSHTRSALLYALWIDALIDAGDYHRALEKIEPELDQVRWKSSWLLRRARARQGLGFEAAARKDLKVALDELRQRIKPGGSDLTLVADRGTAYALLGETNEARKDLAAVRDSGAGSWVVQRLEKLLPAQETTKASVPAP